MATVKATPATLAREMCRLVLEASEGQPVVATDTPVQSGATIVCHPMDLMRPLEWWDETHLRAAAERLTAKMSGRAATDKRLGLPRGTESALATFDNVHVRVLAGHFLDGPMSIRFDLLHA